MSLQLLQRISLRLFKPSSFGSFSGGHFIGVVHQTLFYHFTSTNFRSRTFCELAITVMSLQICIPSATLEAAQKEA
jgi:hypothetical protein